MKFDLYSLFIQCEAPVAQGAAHPNLSATILVIKPKHRTLEAQNNEICNLYLKKSVSFLPVPFKYLYLRRS